MNKKEARVQRKPNQGFSSDQPKNRLAAGFVKILIIEVFSKIVRRLQSRDSESSK
jgi:hypothetical protein